MEMDKARTAAIILKKIEYCEKLKMTIRWQAKSEDGDLRKIDEDMILMQEVWLDMMAEQLRNDVMSL